MNSKSLNNKPNPEENLSSGGVPFQKPIPIDKEVPWDKTLTIISKTDLFGTIEYVNEVFLDVSGYEDHELIAKPHNIIRHPDMPKVVYKLMWDNIKQGNQFHGIIKNLAKSGRYYWAITSFEYSKEEKGKIKNYIAKRKSVPQDVITKHIQPLYNKLLQIEKVSGELPSEKYLVGFLENEGVNYVDYITNIMVEMELLSNQNNSKHTENNVEAKKGFFGRFFS